METTTRNCKQCGKLKPIEQFRPYYGGRKGHYKTCKACEKINSRVKYLEGKGDEIDYREEAELDKLHRLYEVQRQLGLQPPRKKQGTKSEVANLDNMITSYENQLAKQSKALDLSTKKEYVLPQELGVWLRCDLTEIPEYYQEEIYDKLKETYRPQLRIDEDTMLPVYDDTHKEALDAILERFDDYEDKYYEENK